MSNLNWGIVGTGWIGSEMAEALWAVHGTVYGVCGSSLEKAENFAKEYKIEHAYNDLDEMLSDKNIHIVYIATPHNMHYEMMLKSLKAGKHVFCEKAITVNSRQLEECVKVA